MEDTNFFVGMAAAAGSGGSCRSPSSINSTAAVVGGQVTASTQDASTEFVFPPTSEVRLVFSAVLPETYIYRVDFRGGW
jgi:hypothetical protein